MPMRKLGKPTDQRMAMLRQLTTDLLDKGRLETTVTRAKEVAPMAEKMIQASRTSVGSSPKYSAMPPHTPSTILPRLIL